VTLFQRFVKRTFDVVLAGAGLAVLWPLILVCAVLAARDTALPGIFAQ